MQFLPHNRPSCSVLTLSKCSLYIDDSLTTDLKFRKRNWQNLETLRSNRRNTYFRLLCSASLSSFPALVLFTETLRYGCAPSKICAIVLNHSSMQESIRELVTTGDQNIV